MDIMGTRTLLRLKYSDEAASSGGVLYLPYYSPSMRDELNFATALFFLSMPYTYIASKALSSFHILCVIFLQ